MSRKLKNLKAGRFVLYTMREGYSLDNGDTVPTRDMQRLFGETEMPVQRKGQAALRANDDGLFPGFSQTWSVAADDNPKGC
jgi:hypothetical protein